MKTAKKDATVHETAEQLLLRTKLPYEEVAKETRKRHRGARTSVASVRFYASKLRAKGKRVPERERASR